VLALLYEGSFWEVHISVLKSYMVKENGKEGLSKTKAILTPTEI
jgi:hypothetical protein